MIIEFTIKDLKSLDEVYIIDADTQKMITEGIVQTGENSICLKIPTKYKGKKIEIRTKATSNPYEGFTK